MSLLRSSRAASGALRSAAAASRSFQSSAARRDHFVDASDAEFQKRCVDTTSDKPVLVDFYATWVERRTWEADSAGGASRAGF